MPRTQQIKADRTYKITKVNLKWQAPLLNAKVQFEEDFAIQADMWDDMLPLIRHRCVVLSGKWRGQYCYPGYVRIRVQKKRKQNCYCPAYPHPHRQGSGKCEYGRLR